MIINFGKILNLIVFDVIANLYFNVKINSAEFYRVDVGCDFFESKGVVCYAQKRGVGFGTKQNVKAEFILHKLYATRAKALNLVALLPIAWISPKQPIRTISS